MKKIFFVSVIGFMLFEILNVYFIMPMPGSQRMQSIDFAYFLYNYRWIFRVIFGIAILLGFIAAFNYKKWLSILALVVCGVVYYIFNFYMAADAIFTQPKHLTLKSSKANKITNDRIIIGYANNGEAKAYPISLIGFHHQVIDWVGGQKIMVTYCTVCRAGRVFEPIVNGQPEQFRLVGMDHFNAMFEDQTTKSWWRQANGEAIIGPQKGKKLPELFCQQTSLGKWLKLHPNSLIMQPDPTFIESYDSTYKFERGKSVKELTKTDTLSWKDKSWVVGVVIEGYNKAYDWNRLVREKTINDILGEKPIVVALASDNKSFFVYERHQNETFIIRNDTLKTNTKNYNLQGELLNTKNIQHKLKPVKAYQEFWHSWRTFHTNTLRY